MDVSIVLACCFPDKTSACARRWCIRYRGRIPHEIMQQILPHRKNTPVSQIPTAISPGRAPLVKVNTKRCAVTRVHQHEPGFGQAQSGFARAARYPAGTGGTSHNGSWGQHRAIRRLARLPARAITYYNAVSWECARSGQFYESPTIRPEGVRTPLRWLGRFPSTWQEAVCAEI